VILVSVRQLQPPDTGGRCRRYRVGKTEITASVPNLDAIVALR
jgi:hypothetical protein